MKWWFKRSPAKQPNPLCSCCSDPSAGTVQGWHFCTFHLEQVKYRMRRESSR